MVELENNLRFLTNFRYELKGNLTQGRPLSQLSTKELATLIPNTEASSKNHFNSVCDQTMVGFVQNLASESTLDNLEVTCFYAEQDKSQQEDFVQVGTTDVNTLT